MKSICISSNSSGGGKTTVTLGLMKALMKKGHDVQGYKVGPDYIDPAFHSRITGKPSRNLDLYLMGEEGVKAAFSRGEGDVGIVEGVMGLYDGKGVDWAFSTYHVAKVLNIPIILVISPKAQSATLCAEVNGLVNFGPANIGGIIFNNVSESYYKLLKACFEKNCNVKVLGYVPKNEQLSLKSRHLGLVQSSEVDDLNEKVELCSELMLKHVDVDGVLSLMSEVPEYEDEFHMEPENLRIGVAMDKAFSFYYRENLELLSELGEIIPFSPLSDHKLPDNLDFLYIGGGYPEVFAKELSENESMKTSIRNALNSGLKCYAECGGLMYLTDGMDGPDRFDMVGFFSGRSTMTERLQNFGYAELNYGETKINCHEFHKSKVELSEEKVYSLVKNSYDGSHKTWQCGYAKNNVLAGYPHVHFFGNINFLEKLCLKKC